MVPEANKQALIPIERELRERLVWFIRLRWLAALAIVLGGWFSYALVGVAFSPVPIYAIGIGVAGYNGLFYALWHHVDVRARKPGGFRHIVFVQIAIDWGALAILTHYCGGIQSPVAYAYAFHLIIGAIFFSKKTCYVLAVIASSTTGLLVAAGSSGFWFAPVVGRTELLVWPLGEFYRWVVLTSIFLISAFLTTSIADQLRKKERELFFSEQALDRAYGEMEALYELGQVVNATLNLEYILGVITERGTQLMGMKACSVQLLSNGGKRLHVGGAYGLSEGYVHKGYVDIEKSSLAADVLSGRVVQVADVMADPQGLQYPEKARAEGIRSVLCVPMQVKDKAIGVIRVYSDHVHWFSEEEINFAHNLANLGAVAIDNARTCSELKALSEERTWFARTTAHQLRAPLATIEGMLEALPYAGTLSAKQIELIERCRRRLQDPLDMIKDLLELASAQQRPAQKGERVALLACLESVLATMKERAATKGVHFNVDAHNQTVVVANAEDMRRIFSNLLDNAIKYTPAGGNVTFELSARDQEVSGEVHDTGMGIAETDCQRIFDDFYRTEASKTSGEIGTGLGLSIVKQLVEQWDGTVCVESKLGQGSHFEVILPRAPEY